MLIENIPVGTVVNPVVRRKVEDEANDAQVADLPVFESESKAEAG